MEKLYEQMALEMGMKGWGEQRNVVADDVMKAVWKKKGDVGEWVFMMEYEETKHGGDVLCLMCLMCLTVGRKFGAKCHTPVKVLMAAGVGPVLCALNRGVERVMRETQKGGEVWQTL